MHRAPADAAKVSLFSTAFQAISTKILFQIVQLFKGADCLVMHRGVKKIF